MASHLAEASLPPEQKIVLCLIQHAADAGVIFGSIHIDQDTGIVNRDIVYTRRVQSHNITKCHPIAKLIQDRPGKQERMTSATLMNGDDDAAWEIMVPADQGCDRCRSQPAGNRRALPSPR